MELVFGDKGKGSEGAGRGGKGHLSLNWGWEHFYLAALTMAKLFAKLLSRVEIS